MIFNTKSIMNKNSNNSLYTRFLLTFLLLAAGLISHAQQYTYDSNNRLTKVVYASGRTVEYTYDAVGNRKTKTVIVEKKAIPGDANSDQAVDVADVVAIVNYILGEPNDPFVEAAADVNGDGKIDVDDVVAVVNIILDSGSHNSPEMRARALFYLHSNGFIF